MKKLSAILLFQLIFYPTFSQIESYDISSFVRPDLTRSIFEVDANGRLHREERQQSNLDIDADAFASVNLTNSRWMNSQEKQVTRLSSARVNASYALDKSSGTGTALGQTRKTYGNSVFNYYQARKYLSPNLFIEYGHEVDASFLRTYLKNTLFQTDNDYNSYKFHTDLPFAVGLGRKELVNSAWHAVTILEFLGKKGFLKRQLNHDEITNFANEISNIRIARHTELRLQDINAYERLIEYLVNQSIVDTDDYKFFAHLYDVWEYENFSNRWHGVRHKFGIEAGGSILGNYDAIPSEREWEYYPNVKIGYTYDRSDALSVDWQWDHTSSILGKFETSEKEFISFPFPEMIKMDAYFISFENDLTLRYYPSLRTRYSFSLLADVQSEVSDSFKTDFNFRINTDLYYYISPRLRWELDFSFRFYGPELSNSKLYNNRLDLSFTTYYNLY